QEIAQEASLLKLNRTEERGRDIYPLSVDVLHVVAARSYLAGPEGQTGRVRFTIEKIVILHVDKRLCVVDSVARKLRKVVRYLHGNNVMWRGCQLSAY